MNTRTRLGWKRIVAVIGALLVIAGAAAAAWRVWSLEREELEHDTEWRSIAELRGHADASPESVRFTFVELAAGEQAVFELCARDDLDPARWTSGAPIEVLVWRPRERDLLLRTALDAGLLAAARRASWGACLPIGEGTVPRAGHYAIEAVWTEPPSAEISAVPLSFRVLARRPLGPLDRVPVLLALVGALAAVVVFGVSRPTEGLTTGSRRAAIVRLIAGVSCVLAAAITLAHLPLVGGSTMGLARGLVFAGVEILVALLLVQPAHPLAGGRAIALGLVRPVLRLPRWLVAAPRPAPGPAGEPPPPDRGEPDATSKIPAALLYAAVGIPAGLVLAMIAKVAVTMVEPTGEAPIQTFVSWPSGLLSFATLAVVVPLAEELFFRGFVYGIAARFGTAVAFAASVVLFVGAHAPQTWGAWGGLISIAITGLVLTGLRAWTGSTVVPACAHLVYNGVLATAALA